MSDRHQEEKPKDNHIDQMEVIMELGWEIETHGGDERFGLRMWGQGRNWKAIMSYLSELKPSVVTQLGPTP